MIALFLERRSGQLAERLEREANRRVIGAQGAHEPTEAEVRIERRGHELVWRGGCGVLEKRVEEIVPAAPLESDAIGDFRFSGCTGRGVVVHNDDFLAGDCARVSSAQELARVERAVATAAQDDEASRRSGSSRLLGWHRQTPRAP